MASADYDAEFDAGMVGSIPVNSRLAGASAAPGGSPEIEPPLPPSSRKHTETVRAAARAFRRAGTRKVAKKERLCMNMTMWPCAERKEEFLEQLENLQRQTLATERGSVRFTWGEGASGDVYHAQVEHKGAEGLEIHKGTAHMAVWTKFVATKPFSKPMEVVTFTAQGAV